MDKVEVEKVSDARNETTSLTSDRSAVSSAAPGTTESSRRGRRNRRERHKNSKVSSDSALQPSQTEVSHNIVSQPAVNLADSSRRNKSSVTSSSSTCSVTSGVSGRESSKGSLMDAAKMTSQSVCLPPPSSITGT